MATSEVRAKTYANKEGKANNGGKPNKMQVSGDIAFFQRVADKDKEAIAALISTVKEALPS